ncbi:GbsR/MarR family transcriptional regulator [Pseudonocardia sp. WMMC193]|uniref:GbsR/MarR family transcriptional regulator n=1 Tax=Pseudonocardia sp. WMMC193 TaxID=2911965 RepID=UPI001EFFDA8F|nr:MarR family transcriptional regulator [Pseudonocardia sp. WMMC193]MCF7550778.1 MarR family transcriptional regulator [Pseudonocardia sp. WMMC193]
MTEQQDRVRFAERFALDLASTGWPRMSARVFATVLVSADGRLTAAELAQQLAISPGAVSGAVRHLTDVGFLERVREPGSRRDAYQLLDEIWYESFIRADERFARWADTLASASAVVEVGSPAQRRIDDARDFFEFLRESFPELMAQWRQHRAHHRA